jgi:DNA-binding LacI/PurR family transcriptional regulator
VTTVPEKPSGVTIFEVAEEAGVSITTVSHVFSGKRPVGEKTRKRVLATAERMAYRPSARAQALATGRTMALAVQFPLSSSDVFLNPYFIAFLPALSEAAVERGYTFALVPPDPAEKTFLEPLIEKRTIDGAVLLDPRAGDRFPLALAAAGIPFVSLGRVADLPGRPRVDQDWHAGLGEVVAHLRAQGYVQPELIGLPGELSTVIDIERAFAAHVSEPLVTNPDDSSDTAATEVAELLLAERRRPDAFICMTERQAAGVYRAADAMGVRIPHELGVVSLGDSALALAMDPSLSALAPFPEQAGHLLIALIDRALAGHDVPEVTLVPTQLMTRGSTARADAP